MKRNFPRALSWMLIFSIVIPMCGLRVSASAEDGLCVHHPQHTDTCGYAEAPAESPCKFNCEICSSDAKDVSAIVDWSWESEYLAWDESSGIWGLGLPGTNEGNRVTKEQLKDFLPAEINAKLSDGSEKVLSLTWDFSGIPEDGVYEGSYSLSAGLPEGYELETDAPALTVLMELGGGEMYAGIYKFVNEWSFVPGLGVIEDTEGQKTDSYTLNIFVVAGQEPEEPEKWLNESVLPKQIRGWTSYDAGATTDRLKEAGFIVDEKTNIPSQVWGWVNIEWRTDEILKIVDDGFQFDKEYRLHANVKPTPGNEIYVNSNVTTGMDTRVPGSLLPPGQGHISNPNLLELIVNIKELPLKDHIVPGITPANTTVNLFDYWVDRNGASDNDLLDTTDGHYGKGTTEVVPRTGVSDWNKGINKGRLLLFGNGNIHAGFWNKGAGAMSPYGTDNVGMSGIVKRVLEGGYPIIDTGVMDDKISGYDKISDYELCGDHDTTAADKHTSINPQNISQTVINGWDKQSASLDYLFNPQISHSNKKSVQDVKGLFQIDNSGYYYYDMRQNFAELKEETGNNHFILYDAPAVRRTDGNYKNGSFNQNEVSFGNFFPFNTGAQVFSEVKKEKDADGKEVETLQSNANIWSNNLKTVGKNMNHHMGMTVDIDFRQPNNGMVNAGTAGNVPMSFQFSGDDDVWIFIDDVLVLDLGGIHSEIYGTIDFASGKICLGQSWHTNGFPHNADGTVDMEQMENNALETTTLRKQFEDAKKDDSVLWNSTNPNTFASNTSHTLKMFYLERGNYDSSLALRFNLQSQLYQQVKKVDQNGDALNGVQFDLCPAELTTEGTAGAIECLYTDENVSGNQEFYVKRKDGADGDALVHVTTKDDGSALFLDEMGNFFNFADRGEQYYILKETKTPNGYRTLPTDVVLHYNPNTSMLSVANRWSTGAYACSVGHMTGAGRLTYGDFDSATGDIRPDANRVVNASTQRDGLVVAIPMLLRKSNNKWEALYGSNLTGFHAVKIDSAEVTAWREAALQAVLEQAKNGRNPSWNFTWDSENMRLTGVLNDLPGLASRYRVNNPNGDMRMIYGIIEPKALEALGIHENTAEARYEALREYLKEHKTEETLQTIMAVTTENTGSGRGFSFLNADQFIRDFRSLIYIPNEQRELWVMKVDQNGIPRNGAEFGLYDNAGCTGTPLARGTTAAVNGQEGTLIFSPANDKSAGHAQMVWASGTRSHYYLKELSAPDGCYVNPTVVPVVVGTNSIYADAGTRENGVTVMAGVGRLTQTMRQFAMNDEVEITLRDITAVQQNQPSANAEVLPEAWEDAVLKDTADVVRSINLHYGKNAVVDYGLHDKDGGQLYKPFFITDTGFIRARVQQNYAALTDGSIYGELSEDANKDNLGDTDLTSLFSLLNIVVVTDDTTRATNTGRLTVSKMLSGANIDEADYTKNFTFSIRLTDPNGRELTGEYYFYGTNKAGYVSSGEELLLHHDESITILGLPAGTKYTVTEEPVLDQGWYVFPKSGTSSGEIGKDATSFAAFYNSKEPWPDIGFLILNKTVTGGGDKAKEFTFHVSFTDEDGQEIEGDFPYDGDKMGTISSGESITLRHDEHITIFDLPAGTKYTVSEREAGQEGYTTSSFGESGEIADGEILTAAFVNAKERAKPPEDGSGSDSKSKKKGSFLSITDTGDAAAWAVLGIASLSGLGAAFSILKNKYGNRHRCRKKKKNRKR